MIVEGGTVNLSMMRMMTPVKAGELLTLSSGEYSDYHVLTVARALDNFDPTKVARQFELEAGEDVDPHYGFIAMLVEQGLIEELNYREVHVGCYDRLDIYVGKLCEPEKIEA